MHVWIFWFEALLHVPAFFIFWFFSGQTFLTNFPYFPRPSYVACYRATALFATLVITSSGGVFCIWGEHKKQKTPLVGACFVFGPPMGACFVNLRKDTPIGGPPPTGACFVETGNAEGWQILWLSVFVYQWQILPVPNKMEMVCQVRARALLRLPALA